MSEIKRIIIDPGHGEPDPGAIGPRGMREADVNLQVSRLIITELKSRGISAALTRPGVKRLFADSRQIDLKARANVANRINAHSLVSIHCNGATTPFAYGFEIYTSALKNKSDILATSIYDEWRLVFPKRRVRPDLSDGDPDKEANLMILREARVPACLVELGFITNPDEELFLIDSEKQIRMAQAISLGIVNFIGG